MQRDEVVQAERQGADADAEREHQNRDRREARRPGEDARTETQVLRDGRYPERAAALAAILLDLFQATELEP